MKYLHQLTATTGQTAFSSLEECVDFLNQIEDISHYLQQVENKISQLKASGDIIVNKVELIDNNTYRNTKIFGTSEARTDYVLWVKDYHDSIKEKLINLGWNYTQYDITSVLEEDEWTDPAP